MPGFFSNCLSAISMRSPFASSQGHRNAERGNAFVEVVGGNLGASFTPALIATKFAQTGISFYSIFRSDTHVHEKMLHLVQGGISAAQLGLLITLYFNGTNCSTHVNNDICKALTLCFYLYNGALGLGWGPSELSKDPYDPLQAANPVNGQPANLDGVDPDEEDEEEENAEEHVDAAQMNV